jgi:Zn-dependent peptidase ImmA (M78 family)/DNA-binding XRE family transcriptional regulator
MPEALITPQMLAWSRARAGLSPAELARKIGIQEDRLLSWEAGEAAPTFRQAQRLARSAQVPFGFLYLNEPPTDGLPFPDMRTVGDQPTPQISLALRETIKEVWQRQLWYREYQQERDADPVGVIGKADLTAAPDAVVADIRGTLNIEFPPRFARASDYLRDLVGRIEALGVLVMRNSVVSNKTKQPLNVNDFRGFAIADPLAPVIFINTADAPGAQLFTLMHELTHIWLGKSAISDGDPATRSELERFCNAVAAEFLVPADALLARWHEEIAWESDLPQLAADLHASQWAIARRAHDLGLVNDDDYRGYVRRRLSEPNTKPTGGAVPYGRVQKTRIGARFASAVAEEALSGRLLLRDAHRLTGIRPEKMSEFVRKELAD